MNPLRSSYVVVIVGGAMIGSSVAWWLTRMSDARVLVIERDPTYAFASTSHTNSCIRQQFSSPLNVQISQFGVAFIKDFAGFMGVDDAPKITLQSFGYLYLAADPTFAAALKEAQALQAGLGAGTRHMTADEIAADYPFYNLDDIIAGNHNTRDEGYFDGGTMFDWFRKRARAQGAEFVRAEVAGIGRSGDRVTDVTLSDGTTVACGNVVNASGPRASITAGMAGLDIPVEPRKRYTFIFDAAEPLDRDLPLTIDPSGVHVRSDGRYYMAGCPPDDDAAVAVDDFVEDHNLWEDKVWPAVATRVPAFERAKLIQSWVGHYAFNTLDQNAIVGPHDEVSNFIFVNGFSGHGLQQAPAMGRAVAEWITTGTYQTLDMRPLGFARIRSNCRLTEQAII